MGPNLPRYVEDAFEWDTHTWAYTPIMLIYIQGSSQHYYMKLELSTSQNTLIFLRNNVLDSICMDMYLQNGLTIPRDDLSIFNNHVPQHTTNKRAHICLYSIGSSPVCPVMLQRLYCTQGYRYHYVDQCPRPPLLPHRLVHRHDHHHKISKPSIPDRTDVPTPRAEGVSEGRISLF